MPDVKAMRADIASRLPGPRHQGATIGDIVGPFLRQSRERRLEPAPNSNGPQR